MFTKIASILVATTIFCAQSANAQIARQLANVVALVKGTVTSADGSHPAGVPLALVKGTERVTTTKTKPDGSYSMIVNPNAMYRIIVSDPHYMYHEDTVNVPQLSAYEEIPVSTYVTPLTDGQQLPLNVPVFLPKATAIDPKGAVELDKIAVEMKHNAKLSLAVTVYSDKPVSKKDAGQQQIATARAANLRSYFMGKGIPSSKYEVTAVSDHVPAGKFDIAGYTTSDEASAKGGKKKKAAAPVKALVPQFVEVTAHVAQ
jgi:hypothetical protein